MTHQEKVKAILKLRKQAMKIERNLYMRKSGVKKFRTKESIVFIFTKAIRLSYIFTQMYKIAATPKPRPEFPSGGIKLKHQGKREIILKK